MKPVKQTVTYDSSTGKLYEELGASSTTHRLSSSYFQVKPTVLSITIKRNPGHLEYC
jgi:hypothetical protein